MIARARKIRVRWRRAATIGILSYLGFWSAISGVHMWNLWRAEARLNQQIHAVKMQNQLFQQDLTKLRNPAFVKKMVSGQVPVPNSNLARP